MSRDEVLPAVCQHSWVFDGDDPYVVCCLCGERRDAITGRIIRFNKANQKGADVQ